MRSQKAIGPTLALSVLFASAPQSLSAQSPSPSTHPCDPDKQRYADSVGVPCSALKAIARPLPMPSPAAEAPSALKVSKRVEEYSAAGPAVENQASGRLALSLSIPPNDFIELKVRRLDAPGKLTMNAAVGWFRQKPDFSGQFSGSSTGPLADAGYSYWPVTPFVGNVFVKELPPGHYEISDVLGFEDGVVQTRQFYKDLRLGFDIEPGKTTYLGEFGLWSVRAKSRIGLMMFQGWVLVIRDQSARDVPIAMTHVKDLGEVKLSVPNAAQLHRPMIQSAL